MSKARQRNSSLELLRIICMFLIIAHHYVVHGGYQNFSPADPMKSVIYLRAISLFGRSACSVFAMITGYNMVDANKKEHHYRRIVLPLLRMIFCSLLAFFIAYAFGYKLTVVDFLKSFAPFLYLNWYVRVYVFFFFFIPYVNILIDHLDKRTYRHLLLVNYVAYFLMNTLFDGIYDFSELFFMFAMYLIGAYHKRYGQADRKTDGDLLKSLAYACVMVLTSVICCIIGFKTGNAEFIEEANYFASYRNIVSLGFAYHLFCWFAGKEFHNRIIDLVASTTLSIYLLHDNDYLSVLIWQVWSPNPDHLMSPYLHSIVKIVAVFVGGMMIDLLRQFLFKPLRNWLKGKIDRLFDKVENSKALNRYLDR